MSNGRRVLGLGKSTQKQTERAEDALMQKVAAEEGFEDVKVAPPEATTAPSPQSQEEILIDEKVPYAVVRGVPGVEYVQGKDYYDRGKRMVREAPMDQWYFAEPASSKKSDMQRAEEARAELKHKGLWHNVPGHDSPRKSIVGDIEKENARAAAAEQHAA